MQRQQADIFIIDNDVAGVTRDDAHYHVEGRSFTRAVRAKQTHDFAGVDGQTDIFDDAAALIRFREVFCS